MAVRIVSWAASLVILCAAGFYLWRTFETPAPVATTDPHCFDVTQDQVALFEGRATKLGLNKAQLDVEAFKCRNRQGAAGQGASE